MNSHNDFCHSVCMAAQNIKGARITIIVILALQGRFGVPSDHSQHHLKFNFTVPYWGGWGGVMFLYERYVA